MTAQRGRFRAIEEGSQRAGGQLSSLRDSGICGADGWLLLHGLRVRLQPLDGGGA